MSSNEGDGELVSVVVPTYYRNDLLEAAVESVYRQDHRPVEVIVVDDSGEAHAEPVMEQFEEASYVPLEENRGAQAARNVGLEQASGDYVQFLDDDDVLREDKFTKQLPRFSDSVGVVYSGFEKFDSGEVVRPRPHVRGDVLEDQLRMRSSPCSNCTMLIDHAALERVLPLESFHAADDVELMIRLAQETEFDYVDEPLIYVRDLEQSLEKTWENIEARKRIVEKYDHLYDRYPPAMKRQVLSNIYRDEAFKHMESKEWSSRAILSFAKSAYYAPNDGVFRTVECLGSVFGRPGLTATTGLRKYVSSYCSLNDRS